MARHVKDVPVTEEGRDKGKVFRITEMDAYRGEEWAYKLLLALTRAGADVPDASMGMAGIKIAGLQAAMKGLQFEELKPMLDEMMACVTVPTTGGMDRPLTVDDTEEISTRILLRAEVFNLHTDFLKAGLLSTLGSATSQTESSNTPISPGQSVRQSRASRLRSATSKPSMG